MEDVVKGLKRRWSRLSVEEKQPYRSTKDINVYCICKKKYSTSDQTIVMCNICEDWYHVTCLNVSEEYITLVSFYHCKRCINHKLRFSIFLRYTYHFKDQLFSNSDLIAKADKWSDKGALLRNRISQHRYPVPVNYESTSYE